MRLSLQSPWKYLMQYNFFACLVSDIFRKKCNLSSVQPWLARMSVRGTVVLLPTLASEDVCQGYCSTTTNLG